MDKVFPLDIGCKSKGMCITVFVGGLSEGFFEFCFGGGVGLFLFCFFFNGS